MTLVKIFRWLYIALCFVGPYMTVQGGLDYCDIFNGLMAVPNIVALLALSGVVARETRAYFEKQRTLEPEAAIAEPDLTFADRPRSRRIRGAVVVGIQLWEKVGDRSGRMGLRSTSPPWRKDRRASADRGREGSASSLPSTDRSCRRSAASTQRSRPFRLGVPPSA